MATDPDLDVRGTPDWYGKLKVQLTRDGIVPGRRYVIRKKGIVEVSGQSCSTCHSRVMPDGTLVNGAQTAFPLERENAWRVRMEAHNLNGLFFPNWDKFTLADGVMENNMEEYARALEAIPPGVNMRTGVSVLTPPKVADLIGVKDRKYLDLIGRVQHRNIGDMMRYAAFGTGQTAFYSSQKILPAWIVPNPSSQTRLSDEQAFALALYIYSPELHLLIPTGSTKSRPAARTCLSGKVVCYATRRHCTPTTCSLWQGTLSPSRRPAQSTRFWMSGWAPTPVPPCGLCAGPGTTRSPLSKVCGIGGHSNTTAALPHSTTGSTRGDSETITYRRASLDMVSGREP